MPLIVMQGGDDDDGQPTDRVVKRPTAFRAYEWKEECPKCGLSKAFGADGEQLQIVFRPLFQRGQWVEGREGGQPTFVPNEHIVFVCVGCKYVYKTRPKDWQVRQDRAAAKRLLEETRQQTRLGEEP